MNRIRLVLALGFFALAIGGASCVVRQAGAGERQPHMQAALRHLEEAKKELAVAEADKGGHRVKAIEACDLAISETREGINFANQHP